MPSCFSLVYSATFTTRNSVVFQSFILSLPGVLVFYYCLTDTFNPMLWTALVVQFSHSVMSTLCDPVDCSIPGFTVHHQLPELMSVKSVMPSKHLILCPKCSAQQISLVTDPERQYPSLATEDKEHPRQRSSSCPFLITAPKGKPGSTTLRPRKCPMEDPTLWRTFLEIP